MTGENKKSAALDIKGLSKAFGEKRAVDQLDLAIPAGEFHALLGPNGAGKTTTLRMVAGLLRSDAGSVSVFGHDISQKATAAKSVTAFLPDDPLLYGKLTPLEYLEFVAGLWAIPSPAAALRARELLEWLELWGNRSEYAEGFSRGMRQKLALAGAMIHEPKLMILDEPLTGLDARAARSVKDMLVAYVKKGNTVVLTTHILEIAERLAERISIILNGRIVAQGTLDELRSRTGAAVGQAGATLEDVFLELTEPA
ncbi:MAG TPA: ABC transporter [Elusimicrobia bacterium]|nr:MAG: ABC transporter [Elusimicrobia bacterium GWD2_63_28]HCC47763.1 ABC transporter [Elusimicrobiota bacterium]